MHPILCQIGPLRIYSYGFMLAVAVLLCASLLGPEAKRRGQNPEDILDLVFWIVMSGIIGARIFYILLNWQFFLSDPAEILKLHHGGLAFQGGLVGGFLGG